MISDEEVQRIKELHAKGMSLAKIAREVGVDPKTAAKFTCGSGRRARGGRGSAAYGDLAARVFSRLAKGQRPDEVVVAEELPPATVKELYQAWADLKGLPVSVRASQVLVSLQQRVAGIEAGLANDPTYDIRRLWRCTCGATGCVRVVLECSSCGEQEAWGWPEEEQE